jgi:hypothetical protein
MLEQEYYFEIQYSTVDQPNYWRSVGYPYKSFIEVSQKVREYIDRDNIKVYSLSNGTTIHSFRIVERRVHITTEEIKTFKI